MDNLSDCNGLLYCLSSLLHSTGQNGAPPPPPPSSSLIDMSEAAGRDKQIFCRIVNYKYQIIPPASKEDIS